MKQWSVKESDMHESEGGWPGKVEVVFAVDAEAEIEKARREALHEAFTFPGLPERDKLIDQVRADERERIVRDLRKVYDEQSAILVNGMCKGIALSVDHILRDHPQGPKLLEAIDTSSLKSSIKRLENDLAELRGKL